MRFSALFSLAAAVVAMPACGGDSGPGIVPTGLIFVAQPTAVLYGAVLIPAVKVALVDGDGTHRPGLWEVQLRSSRLAGWPPSRI